MYPTIGKPFEKLTNDDLRNIELSFGHDFYW